MWCIYIGYEGLCGAFMSVMNGCVVPIYISYEGFYCAFTKDMSGCVVPLYQL